MSIARLCEIGKRHPTSSEYSRLSRARQVLSGQDERGNRIHPSMFDPDVISFAHGEGLRRPHRTVVSAGVMALIDTQCSSLENYLFMQRIPRLDELIAQRFQRVGIPESISRNIAIDCGTTRLFVAFLQLLSRPGDVFITAPGFYHPLAGWCHDWGVRLVCVSTRREFDYKLTPDDLELWWNSTVDKGTIPKPVGLMLFNPSMVGAIYSSYELRQLAEWVIKHDLLVLEDAIFSETEFDETIAPARIAACPGMENRVFTITGGSKVHGLANIRIAWGCGPKSLIDHLNRFITSTGPTVPQLAKLMALAALEAPLAYIERHASECLTRVRQICVLIDEVNSSLRQRFNLPADWKAVRVELSPKAGHSILLSFDALSGLKTDSGFTINDSIDLTRYFLDTAKVAFSPGLSLGWDGCLLRCNFGCIGTEFTFSGSTTVELREIVHKLSRLSRKLELTSFARSC